MQISNERDAWVIVFELPQNGRIQHVEERSVPGVYESTPILPYARNGMAADFSGITFFLQAFGKAVTDIQDYSTLLRLQKKSIMNIT
ncbi:hypothetical protein EVAR_65683_1 [Eumeta japonica]|uniref:Uncharacterized protein n=1 Tax=Eumeta variegata TaxID=151549 RepID=A0A4C1Z9T7_EUMVA|nr:hypothetical protein EVAR_65683_1 [Eumeta japonica]